MDNIKTRYAWVVSILLMTGTVSAEPSLQDAAESDQLRISAFVNTYYAGYVENYLKVFSGHFRCDYDFVDEATFNELAEDALKSLSAAVRSLLGQRLQTTQPTLSPEQLDYTSTLVALSVIDAQADRYTAEIDSLYAARAINCSDAEEENRTLYNNLPANLATISTLSIPAD
jgi:hypothetical protein